MFPLTLGIPTVQCVMFLSCPGSRVIRVTHFLPQPGRRAGWAGFCAMHMCCCTERSAKGSQERTGDVVGDGHGEEVGVLRHDADLAAVLPRIHLRQVLPVHQDLRER